MTISDRDLHVEYWQTRDPALRERLVERHLRLALHLAKRFGPRGSQSQDDVNQVASMALVKAIEGFDPSRGFRFSTYATSAILGELKRNLRDHTWSVRPSRSAHDLYLAVEAAVDELTHELRRSPTIPELADRVGVSVEDVLSAREVAGGRVASSLDQPLAGRQERLGDGLGGEDPEMGRVEQRMMLRSAVHTLSDQQRYVLGLRFQQGMSQAAIARELGCSQMHVSRVLRRTLSALRGVLADDAA